MNLAFLRGLEKAPTFLVPIINPPFADNSPHPSSPGPSVCVKIRPGSPPSLEEARTECRAGVGRAYRLRKI